MSRSMLVSSQSCKNHLPVSVGSALFYSTHFYSLESAGKMLAHDTAASIITDFYHRLQKKFGCLIDMELTVTSHQLSPVTTRLCPLRNAFVSKSPYKPLAH
ncbi:Hypothetical protein HEAR0077 [Herminiimonas arsenicoxydans]|uniref:Uncharacterized protein n=1 Tax=Herminiimonas arsenicoxydans TaxID=204773 RepID=A4G1C6_HERAR|nr:Hypothetical protein HEAR0077 [Herminiimonas arsenicoxydans]